MAYLGLAADYWQRLFRSRYFWALIGIVALFWTCAYLFPFAPVYATPSALLFVTTLFLVVSYFPGFLHALASNKLRDGEQLVMGIWVAWFGDLLLRTWAMSQRYLGFPEWMIASDFVSFIITIKLIGATLHLTSPGTTEGKIPKGTWIMVGAAFLLGATIAIILLVTSIGAGIVSP